MRDTMLFVSGRLDDAMGGRSVDTANDPMCRRRSVYGLVDRQNLPGLFRAFDFPAPDQCNERRPRTSVPQQALFALNSPFVFEQASALIARSEVSSCGGATARVKALFRVTLGREPTDSESAKAMNFVEAAGRDTSPENKLSPWEQLAQVLLISNEAIFLD